MTLRRFITYILFFITGVLTLVGCSGVRYVEDGDYLLQSVKVESEDSQVDVSSLSAYVRQRTNTKWLSFFKVPLGLYSMSGSDTTKFVNKVLRKWGEKPVLYDSVLTDRTVVDLSSAMRNDGYLNATVEPILNIKGKRASLVYHVYPGTPYVVRKVSYNILDLRIDSMLKADKQLENIHSGQVFSVNGLNAERKRITEYLTNHGYYQFNKEFIHYDVDSSLVERYVDITMHLDLYRRNIYQEAGNHPAYIVDSVTYEGIGDGFKLRKKVLEQNTLITVGQAYSSKDLQDTYNRFSRLQAVRYTNIRYDENQDSMLLSCHIQLSPQKTHSIQFQPEGTNTAGDFGAAASLTYQNRNLFHGSELLDISARGAFEAIRGLEGYQSEDYEEYGFEARMTSPRYMLPWLSHDFIRQTSATSELVISFNRQNRPEFHRRLLTTAWRYKWSSPNGNKQYKVDLLDLNYISMPWISETFKKEYLDSVSNRNAILRYNYEDLLIMKIGFGLTYTSKGNTLRFNFESAGNLLNALSKPLKLKTNAEGQYKLFNIAYAQYVKGDIDYTHLLFIDDKNSLALHARLGIAYPYGNSTILPFEKRYFSGGANSVRGWSVRGLGPGKYTGKDGKIDFINQTGDMRIDLNAEMRSQLFWKFQGALFVDAGNIWTLRDYSDQPYGKFRIAHFWQEMAVAYGLGLRLNFDYFIIRFDMGMKAVNPSYSTSREHYPIFHPKFSRDHAFHFAVGLPF